MHSPESPPQAAQAKVVKALCFSSRFSTHEVDIQYVTNPGVAICRSTEATLSITPSDTSCYLWDRVPLHSRLPRGKFSFGGTRYVSILIRSQRSVCVYSSTSTSCGTLSPTRPAEQQRWSCSVCSAFCVEDLNIW